MCRKGGVSKYCDAVEVEEGRIRRTNVTCIYLKDTFINFFMFDNRKYRQIFTVNIHSLWLSLFFSPYTVGCAVKQQRG